MFALVSVVILLVGFLSGWYSRVVVSWKVNQQGAEPASKAVRPQPGLGFESSAFRQLYLEAHITVEPMFDERFTQFRQLCEKFGFKAADLFLQKRLADTPERSSKDAFCTGRGTSIEELEHRMVGLMACLQLNGFKIWRYKIESVVLDSRKDDSRFTLGLRKEAA